MVESMKLHRLCPPSLLGTFFVMLMASLFAWAGDENLPDPTRIPAVLSAPMQGKGGASGEGTGSSGHVLQSVILRKGLRPAANVGGQWVELGGEIGGAKVIAITESRVVLNGPEGREVLELTPDAVKRPAVTGKKAMSSIGGAH